MEKGKIVKSISGFFDIKNERDGKIYRVRGSGKLRLLDMQPIVGDYVEFEPNELIHRIMGRKNFFIRPKIANVDQAIVVMSLVEPEFSSLLIDKFLIIIENKGVEPIIVLTKKDLTSKSKIDFYKEQGYKIFEINYQTEEGFDGLRDIFKNKTSFFVGQTGVGKTTLINYLAKTNFKTQEISLALNRGKHTTREVSLIDFNGGEIIDTPGFSSIEFDLTINEMPTAFFSFREASKLCKFRTCKHYQELEKDCEVKRLVSQGKIKQERYANYCSFLERLLH
ncbi:ribosome small subunit-dependent GTPase A [Metamycoplasma hyosynoviae]|uniref:ribosome small subunit-dependent GTPase A n=1 Tax=Metamycoplasma hyosynoviae TaxID=29559 RepID=UPI0023588C33|nr:ribosome small subunit-dependent GTPase A [Metamycoplasma hyosynoviae]MDC8921696.1 ribosome small subunit-dependent GTPase A [Metamycoplasma hyosynoviae]MDD1366431.1 ribosome small subunit-dependent GTPase A [Metamycoplasma hyosynoviae]MDD1378065.1 ribosome small subunit-dependent GTPase A [Metamycoplasma hyosynoviae]MDD7898082.1 ribosome small subunit-dependent GTPase A [Metamycoplasma hyosynoviae]